MRPRKLFLSCVGGGYALNTIEKVKYDNNGLERGYLAWKALSNWYLDPSQKYTMVSHWETKLNSIKLDVDSSCTEFINNIEMYTWNFKQLGEAWGDDKIVREFKARSDRITILK